MTQSFISELNRLLAFNKILCFMNCKTALLKSEPKHESMHTNSHFGML